MGLAWWILGCFMFIIIIGIPWGRSCFVIGRFTFFPFGKEVVSRRELSQKGDIGTGCLGTIGNIIWFIGKPHGFFLSGIFMIMYGKEEWGVCF